MRRRTAALTLTGAFILACAGSSSAQGAAPPPDQARAPFRTIEYFGGLTVVGARADSMLTTAYVPAITSYSDPLPGSTAGQSLQMRSSRTVGLEGGFNYFFRPDLGVQVLVGYDRCDLSGQNADYRVLLNYSAMQPPDYIARSYTFDRTFPAVDTTGSLSQLTVGLNGIGRWAIGRRLTAELSGGLSYIRMGGNAQPLRYTAFGMGGHSTLFSEDYQLAVTLESAGALGINLGGGLDVELLPGVSVMADARYFRSGNITANVSVTRILNETDLITIQDLATIQRTLRAPAVTVNPDRARVMVGLRIRR